MPILLLGLETEVSEWRQFLERIEDAVFCSRDSEEALLVLEECEKLGTPVGLVVVIGKQWTGQVGDAIERIRTKANEYSRQIFVACETWSQAELYASVEAGVNTHFEYPWDWGLIERKTRRALSVASQATELQSQKQQAEVELMQHKQSIVHHDLWRLDLRSRSVEFSQNFRKLSGFSESEVQGNLDECLTLIHPLDLSRLSKALTGSDWRALPEELNFEFRLRHRNGGWRWVLMRGRLERDEQGDAVAISGSHTDITEAKTIDPITGLANRFQFEDWLEDNLHADGLSLGVFLVGIDRYSMIRDSLGQAVGDQLLRLASERLRSSLDGGLKQNGEWILARLNEEEFAIAMPGIENESGGRAVAELIQGCLEKGIWLQGNELFVSTSVGFVLREDRKHADEVWRDAEIALRLARSGGGNRVVLFDHSMREDVLQQMALENDLKRAIEQWEFEVYYQPKVDLMNKRIIGFEALLRWRHPIKGVIPPNQFIPLAESTGLIIPIGIRTVREACETIRDWQEEFPQRQPLEVSVNLSVRQFQDRHLIEDIRKILDETRIIPSTLQFEVTESVLVIDPEQALEIVKELRRIGVGLKIDDFGTGYSSLSYLHRLPFDTLKIDRSFITTMGDDHAAFEIVRAIILLAGSLGLQVVAEGIETQVQADELRSLGCGFGQGYLFAPPLTKEAARRMLEAQTVRAEN
ncbi:MAG: GGDEF and EAL domain-containing protein [Acidobacteria bacterium]|nr:GGDEF and EAL domain-containing protein [Acidobacteriota bacterium]